MLTWWEENLRMFSAINLKREDFLHLVIESRLLFRYGIGELMQNVQKLRIPFSIVSGGVTEIIEAHFTAVMIGDEITDPDARKCWDQTRIYSNEFTYHEEGFTVDFKRPIIHILNKQQFIYEQHKDFKRNIIVMGDILEDIHMVRETEHDVVLKIGFLNN